MDTRNRRRKSRHLVTAQYELELDLKIGRNTTHLTTPPPGTFKPLPGNIES
jgi:hypothetical protein